MVADVIARIVRSRSKREPVLDEKLLHEGARAKLLAMTAFAPEIMTRHADLANAWEH